AIIEFEGALICYEEVQNSRSAILARNNIGFLYYSIGLYDEALRVLEAAERQAREIQDKNHSSIVSDTLARALIARGDYRRAIETAAASVKYLGSVENSNLLATALITLGIAFARSGESEKAKSAFDRAEEVAGFIQDFTLARVARLFALREMFFSYTRQERLSSYLSLVKNLSGSQEKDISDALGEVAAKIEREIEAPAPTIKENPLLLTLPVSLDEELKSTSRRYVEAAIRQTGGNQSRSAALLGMSRQTFVARVKKDFPDLFSSSRRRDRPEEAVETVEMSEADSIDDQTNAGDDRLAVTEIQADYREIRRGDLLIVKLGAPEVNKHVLLGDPNSNTLKIGFYSKNAAGYFLETAGGGRLELNEAGRNRIIGEVAGFCRRSDCQKSRVVEESNGERKSYELICETLAG
ncbi:MAG: tetratricopeptide repeat protein, partial [Pyrinomonadaceae bacterium]